VPGLESSAQPTALTIGSTAPAKAPLREPTWELVDDVDPFTNSESVRSGRSAGSPTRQRPRAAAAGTQPGAAGDSNEEDQLDDEGDEDAAQEGDPDAPQQRVLMQQLLSVEEPVMERVARRGLAAPTYTPIAPGTAWLRLPGVGATVPVPDTYSVFAGAGTLLGLQQTTYVLTPCPDAGVSFTRGLTVTRYAGLRGAPMLRTLHGSSAGVARLLTQLHMARHAPPGPVGEEEGKRSGTDGAPRVDMEALRRAVLASEGGEAGAASLFTAPDDTAVATQRRLAAAPDILASWHVPGATGGLSASLSSPAGSGLGSGSSVPAQPQPQRQDVFGLEYVTAHADAPALAGARRGLHFNLTVVVDWDTDAAYEICFQAPADEWDEAWEGEDVGAEHEAAQGGEGAAAGVASAAGEEDAGGGWTVGGRELVDYLTLEAGAGGTARAADEPGP
jgi:hypothetical protein